MLPAPVDALLVPVCLAVQKARRRRHVPSAFTNRSGHLAIEFLHTLNGASEAPPEDGVSLSGFHADGAGEVRDAAPTLVQTRI